MVGGQVSYKGLTIAKVKRTATDEAFVVENAIRTEGNGFAKVELTDLKVCTVGIFQVSILIEIIAAVVDDSFVRLI